MANKSFLLHYVLPAVVLGVGIGIAKLRSDETDRDADRAKNKREAATPPAKAQPIIDTTSADPATAAIERAAAEVVLRRCDFWEQPHATADYVPHAMIDHVEEPMANVAVRFDGAPNYTNGNVLWYMVRYTPDGKMLSLSASKAIAAKLCGLGAIETWYPL